MSLIILTQSSLKTLLQCEEKYRLRHIANLRRSDRDETVFATGSAFHEGIEHRSARRAAFAYLRDRSADMLTGDALREVQLGAAAAYAATEAALLRWGDDWPERQEVEFDLRLRNPSTGRPSLRHAFHGVIDGLGSEGESRWSRTIGEWKTAANPGEGYFDRLKMDWQVSAYCEAASKILGVPVRRVRYRVVQKPSIKPRRGETEWEFEERVRNRAPLPPIKPRFLKSIPKGVKADGGGFFRHRDAEFTWGTRNGERGYPEREASFLARIAKRESEREPLKRRIPEEPGAYLLRCKEWYAAHPEAVVEDVFERTEEQMARWRAESWALHLRALDVERAHDAAMLGEHTPRVPIRNDTRCTQFGGRCDYLDLCSGLVGPEAYEVVEPHPELSGKADAEKRI